MTNLTKTAIITVVYATFAIAAKAAAPPTPNQKAEAEARSFLTPCQQPDHDVQMLCRANQSNFIRYFVYAKAGDPSGMSSTSTSFDGPWRGSPSYKTDVAQFVGEPYSPLQACAWRLARAAVEPDGPIQAATTCDQLPEADQIAARRRADQLVTELRSAPARMPPDDWSPSPR